MTITPGLTADLELLTQALDLPGNDVTETLTRLAVDARTAVDSYVGLSVAFAAHWAQFDLTVLDDGAQAEDIQASLLVPLSTLGDGEPPSSVALILYAATPGAFVDLAADLSWITGRPLTDFRFDEHRRLRSDDTKPTPLVAHSTINQALGVLIGRGSTTEQAERDLYERAATAGIDPWEEATAILAALEPPNLSDAQGPT